MNRFNIFQLLLLFTLVIVMGVLFNGFLSMKTVEKFEIDNLLPREPLKPLSERLNDGITEMSVSDASYFRTPDIKNSSLLNMQEDHRDTNLYLGTQVNGQCLTTNEFTDFVKFDGESSKLSFTCLS